ncbi:SAM-dependent methyltransferase [Pseudoalteromonas sp. CNC9-20]|uniref:SAM-dependent methyltransferase n=1 Tax=Pseudoalteromonas sp. CNC9-20 TaxID=2917750 RepID=UPI001EF59F3C|nr:SAM-dependent methyltransferase [Pseudoalteromonas sp. CNC9-20]MCG7570529.1 SAM-dependent methyltransferase [Pseudoalteromonas sp. CNC9-20]
MSSTNRGAVRNKDDYYVTPHWLIEQFLDAIKGTDLEKCLMTDGVLDPSCGGCSLYEPSYPAVLAQRFSGINLTTADIRIDARTPFAGLDFLESRGVGDYGVVITNPPFNISIDFVNKALEHVCSDGYVVMLQRLNWLGTKDRKAFWDTAPLQSVYVHSKRPSFFPDKKGKTDSIEYAHFVFKKGSKSMTPKPATIHVI